LNNIEEKIISLIDGIRPYLISDGGNIEFIKYEDNIVYVSMKGACANCAMLDFTLKESIEAVIKDEIPEVQGVVNII